MTKPFTLIVFISGNGSNLQAIIDTIQSKELNITISGVISNVANAYGLTRAKNADIPTFVLPHQDFADRESYDLELLKIVETLQPDLIVLAGFMRILGPEFVRHYPNKIINIHPSLLPRYRGTKTHQRVLEAGDHEHGASIHYVTEDLDAGPVIAQAKLEVHSGDTAETLKARVQELEHTLYPEIIEKLALDKGVKCRFRSRDLEQDFRRTAK